MTKTKRVETKSYRKKRRDTREAMPPMHYTVYRGGGFRVPKKGKKIK